MIINKPKTPRCVMVGVGNLMTTKVLPHLIRNYLIPLGEHKDEVSFFALSGDVKNNKYLKKDFDSDLQTLIEYCENNDIKTIACTSPKFFAFATKDKNFMMHMEKGDILNGVGNLEGFTIVPVLSYFMLLPQPQKRPILDFSLETLRHVLSGTYVKTELIIDKVNVNVIDTISGVEELLQTLIGTPRLTMDIETTGLRVGRDKILTIAFADSEENGWSIPLCFEYWLEIITKDMSLYTLEEFENNNWLSLKESFISLNGLEGTYSAIPENNDKFLLFIKSEFDAKEYEAFTYLDNQERLVDEANSLNEKTRELTKTFFENYVGEQVWHNFMFDIPFIMRDLLKISPRDNKLTNDTINNWTLVDTMILKYLCVNSIERKGLGLKEILLPFYGEYDKDIDQSNLLDYSYYDVGKYNVYDATGTYLAHDIYRPMVVTENQDKIYQEYYLPNSKQLVKIKYRGVYVDIDKLNEADTEMDVLIKEQYSILQGNAYIVETQEDLCYDAMIKYNKTHVRQKTLDDFNVTFNPNSTAHKRPLLIDVLGYPVIEKTKTGNPSLGKDVIKTYNNEEKDPEKKEVLDALLSLADASKVSSSFIKGFKKLMVQDDVGDYRLHGSYKIASVVSGRLSASEPNFQQLPSGSTYSKLIQRIMKAPDGFIFGMSDFNALESRVSTYITEDPASIKVIKDNYDSHSLNTAVYFQEELAERGLPFGPDITAEEALRIKKEAPDLRQDSKSVTFGILYGSTEHGVAKSLGCSLERALVLVDRFKDLYSGIYKYYDKVTKQAKKDGFYITPYGLKVRAEEINAEDEAKAHGAIRTAQNTLFQGTGAMTMIDSLNRFQSLIEENGYDDDVIIIATVHDSVELYIRDDLTIIKWVNDNLINEMCKDLFPNQVISNDAELDIGMAWSQHITLPKNASEDEIKEILIQVKKEFK